MAVLKRSCQWMLRWRYPAVPVALGLLLASPSLWGGLTMDDYTIRAAVMNCELADGVSANPWEPFTFLDGDRRTWRMIEAGLLPWWTDPDCRLAFWRPLTAVTHMLDYRVWPDQPWLMHVQSLLWFGLLIGSAGVLYRRMIGPPRAAWAAALAALLFALDDAHAYPAGWLANRNELLAASFAIFALVAHDRWRRDGSRAGAWLAPGLLLAALLAKESAVSTGGYLLAYAMFLDRGTRRSRWLSLLPCILVGTAWYAAYKGFGFGVSGSGVYVDPADDPMGFVRHVVAFAPILLLAQWALPWSDLCVIWSAPLVLAHWLFAVLCLALIALLFAPLVLRDRVARFWALGMLLSVVPACLAFPMDRLLVFTGLGAMGLLAQLLAGWKDGGDWVPQLGAWRRAAGVGAGVLLAIHALVAPALLFLVMISLPRLLGQDLHSIMRGYPSDPHLPRQTLVVVNPVFLGADWLLTQQRQHSGEPLPRRRLLLTTACSAASVSRTDARTLVVGVQGGYLPPLGRWPGNPRPPAVSHVYGIRMFDRLVRGDRNPLRLGEVIDLPAVRIEISEVTADGRPAEVRFRFATALEDDSLRWLQASDDGYLPFRPPAIGETVEVTGIP